MLEWTRSAGAVRDEMSSAVGSNAAYAISRIESGQPVNHLHAVIERVLDRAELVMDTSRWGTGIELGAGAAYASAALSRRPGVERVYALEYSPEYVTDVMPRLFDARGADQAKLVRVVGDFNELDLPGGALDFALGIGALHHSEDLRRTLSELNRVLRVGGWLIAIERWQPDNLTDDDLDRLLDVPLADDLVVRYGFERGHRLTRRDMGEHELRLSDWKVRLHEAGFEPFPFAGVDFSGRRAYAALGAVWRAVLRARGESLLRARRWQLLGSQIPFDLRWLYETPGPSPINLLLLGRKYRAV
jgi:SAM-dependent methyltransferase